MSAVVPDTNHEPRGTRERPRTPELVLQRIAVAVDDRPESRDALAFGAAVAQATGADLMLMTVEPDLTLLMPGNDAGWLRPQTEAAMKEMSAQLPVRARVAIDRDVSVPRGLRRLVVRHHRQLLIVGSARQGETGQVSIAGRTRQLIDRLPCALAIAPRGYAQRRVTPLRRVGVGFDGEDESLIALAMAEAIAGPAGAELIVRGVVDERPPVLGWPSWWVGPMREAWDETIDDEVTRLRAQGERAIDGMTPPARVQVRRGRAAPSLRTLSGEVDALVLGSRRWGPAARLLLGGTGEALVHGSQCPLVLVPRPRRTPATGGRRAA